MTPSDLSWKFSKIQECFLTGTDDDDLAGVVRCGGHQRAGACIPVT